MGGKQKNRTCTGTIGHSLQEDPTRPTKIALSLLSIAASVNSLFNSQSFL